MLSVRHCKMTAQFGQTIELAGPETLDWREIVQRVAAAAGKSKTHPANAFVGHAHWSHAV